MKPNLAFLDKVERGEVYSYKSFSFFGGSHIDFYGYETTVIIKHANAGLIIIRMPRMIWMRGKITLTPAGQRALHPFLTNGVNP